MLADVADWLRVATLAVGDVHVRDALRVQVLPFMAQDDYDRLLWCCDLNAVRGEDSLRSRAVGGTAAALAHL